MPSVPPFVVFAISEQQNGCGLGSLVDWVTARKAVIARRTSWSMDFIEIADVMG